MNESHHRQMDDLATRLRRGQLSRREFLARSSAVLAAGAMAGLPGALRAQDATPKAGGFMRLGLHNASQNDNLDPGTWSTSWTGASFNGGVYNNLVEILPDGSVAGDLAESWEAEPGAKVWHFKLRPGVTFHNGKSLDAEDVRQSLEHHMKPDSTSGARAIVQQIEKIDISGTDTVTITLTEANADLPYLLSDYHLSIYPALEGGGIDMESGSGTGAFTLASFEPGIATRLARNPNYHKNNKPYLDEVEFINITDATARLNALLTGEVDFIQDLDIRNVPMVEGSADFGVQRVPSLRHFTFDMDTRVAPFDNPDVRLALKYALDRDDVIDKVFLGEGTRGNDNPVASIQKFYHDMPPREHSIEKAKEHLAKAGLDTVSVDLSVADMPSRAQSRPRPFIRAMQPKPGSISTSSRKPRMGIGRMFGARSPSVALITLDAPRSTGCSRPATPRMRRGMQAGRMRALTSCTRPPALKPMKQNAPPAMLRCRKSCAMKAMSSPWPLSAGAMRSRTGSALARSVV